MDIISLFAGCGGLDLGFERAGFNIVWANEFDKDIWETYEYNHKNTPLNHDSITDIAADDIPECEGIIGGPPCQSWSIGGSKRGMDDHRGQLFWDYIRILSAKNPKFFVAENVSGMLLPRYGDTLEHIKNAFRDAGEYGYDLYFVSVNAADYNVPEDRKRVFFIGFRKDLNVQFKFPEPITPEGRRITLRDAIWDLRRKKVVGLPNGIAPRALQNKRTPNHEYMIGGFSPIFLSRNRIRGWDEVSFTIQAGGRQSPLHPDSPEMIKIDDDHRVFVAGREDEYRRLSVREIARIQTFPDDFIFKYDNIATGYKMIGNAVPVNLAFVVAQSILEALNNGSR